MTSTLVATKLFVPTPRDVVVERRRLIERLERGAASKLTLISAPAGFGKTTLVSAWLAARSAGPEAVAWLSLQQTDNEPAVFWTYVIAAFQKSLADRAAASLHVLEPGQHSSDLVLASLVNELASAKLSINLILDDYHVIDEPDVQAGMKFLLEHLPPHVHIVITTRADPPLPIAKMRARGEVVEIRSADLRFTADEMAAYLNGMMGLGLTANEIAALEERTEGWIASLQLAALSMEGRADPTSFIAGFAGSDRYVFDYLVEEVMERLSDDVRSFLLDTCFLDRLSGELCDAVIGRTASNATLAALYRANLFLVPLDDRSEWYRYHHLFADVLLTQLDAQARSQLPRRHQKASDWYEQHGERSEAIRHALAAEDFERAARLIELAIPETQKHRGEALIRSWARQLPDELVRNRPVLGIGFVGALMSYGEFEGMEERLRDIERGLAELHQGDQSPCVVVVDETQVRRLPGAIELYRAALAQVRGDVAATIEHARRVLDLVPEDDDLGRASGSGLLGIGYWSLGDLEAASRSWTDCKNGLRRIGHIADTLGVSIALADIQLVQGHLRAAAQLYEQALQVAATESGAGLRGTADMHAGLSQLLRERNDLEAAHRHLSKSHEIGERAGLPQQPYRWRVAAAQLLQDEGQHQRAAELLDEAERLYVSDFFPNVRPVAAIRARTFIVQRRLDDARRWQRAAGIGIDDELSYLREFEHITLARVLLAQEGNDRSSRTDQVSRFLDRLLEAAERGGRAGSVIEISILQSIAHRHSDADAALGSLERALALAAPEGYVRLFINEGPAMEALLKIAVKRRIAPDYARELLAAYGPPEVRPQRHPDLIEPLSERELDVLRLLSTDLAGPEIARELAVSENTMRTHTRNIYDKLGVNNRRSAVRRAEELDLLTRAKRQ
ncbi:LuxR C-terminal-related transcriptional regulator [Devosia sp. CN2-171]|uniref:LuxR C-terminal-related transcriptional regulator n=1 Tax=Devosia sp. CN2-171 TaxID=3400909 RepID=UPI003BF7D04A